MWILTTVLGVVVLVVAVTDALATTINVTERPPPLARAVLRTTRRPLRALLVGRRRALVGLLQTVLLLGTWGALLWGGWTLVLLADPVVLVRGESGAAAGVIDHLYVAGYAVFTLGNGDFSPATPAAQVLIVLAAGSGLAVVTLAVTYLLGLTGASQHKRRLARMVHGLGEDAHQMVRRSWTGSDFGPAAQALDSLATDVTELAEHHAAFPVLHEFAATRRELAAGPALLALLDAVTLMRACADDRARLPEMPAVQLGAAVDELLHSMPELEPQATPPPAPGTGVLEELGITVAPPPSTGVDEATHARRRGLHALAVHEGWPSGTAARAG
jgi:hypothetical protein